MEKIQKHIYVVLLAGGSGTRLWPTSRSHSPKQFNKLLGKHTLFQETIKRVKGMVPLSRVIIITNQEYVDDIIQQEPLIAEENIIAEPIKRNTALAMGVATAFIYKRDPQAVIINLATDHLIQDSVTYQQTLLTAASYASEKKCIVSVGIVPTFAHTGLGYIKAGAKVEFDNKTPIFKVDSFKEKPDEQTAKAFLASGDYFWNANNYVWDAATILDEFKTLSPDLYQNIMRIYDQIGTANEKQTLKIEYLKAREEQIDTAISEKTSKLYVIPGEFGWNDVGDWQVVYDLSEKDADGNHISIHGTSGRQIGIDTKNCLIHTQDQMIATIGVEDLVIIDTKDAILICKKDRAQDVKKLVNMLKEENFKHYL